MKTKVAISILFCLNAFLSVAQMDSVAKKKQPITPKWQIGVNINTVEQADDFLIKERIIFNSHRKDNSYCLGMNISYRLKGDFHARLGFKYTNNRAEEIHDSRSDLGYGAGGGYNIDTLNSHQTVVYYTPGISYGFQYKRLDFYGGFQVVYKNYGIITSNTLQWFYYSDGTLNELIRYKYTGGGGYAIGLGAFGGFSINIWKGISIGAELSSTYSYYDIGGKTTIVKDVVNFTTPSNSYYGDYQETYRTFKGRGFSDILSSLNISFKF